MSTTPSSEVTAYSKEVRIINWDEKCKLCVVGYKDIKFPLMFAACFECMGDMMECNGCLSTYLDRTHFKYCKECEDKKRSVNLFSGNQEEYFQD